MTSIFKNGALLKTREYLSDYVVEHEGKTISCVGVDDDYPDHICYPYDLVHKLGISSFSEVPELKFIKDDFKSTNFLLSFKMILS